VTQRPPQLAVALLLVTAAGCAARRAPGAPVPRLEVSARASLVDTPVRIRVTGLAPRQRVRLEATTPFQSGVLRAAATYEADRRGVVDLTAVAPQPGGSYAGIDGMGLFWSMQRDASARDTPAPDERGWAPPAPYTVAITARVDATVVARTVLERRFLDPAVTARDVAEDGVVGRLYTRPGGGGPRPVVIVLGGAEGGVDDVRAPLLASHGYAALALAYFRAPGLPDELFDVPVETVERAVAWVRRQPGLDPARIAVRGSSRGGELALLAAARIPAIRAVVAEVPSDAAGQGIDRAGRSRPAPAWTWRGAPVPFLRQTPPPEFTAQFARQGPPYRLRPLYEASRGDTARLRAAQIPVERTNGPVLLVSADDDQFWPSATHAEALVARAAAARFAHRVEHVRNPGAGHQLLVPYLPTPPRASGQFWMAGGSAEAYARADAASWRATLRFLESALGRR
jgi:hypothetical protein